MKKYALILALAIAVAGLLAGSWSPSSGLAQSEPEPAITEHGIASGPGATEVVPNQIVVRVRAGAPLSAIAALNAAHGGVPLKVQAASGLWRIGLPAGANTAQVAQAYERSPWVQEAGASLQTRLLDAPNDTNYAYQWHMQNTVGGMWAEDAWGISTTHGQGVVVAVIDTGAAYEDHTGVGGLSTQTFVQAPDLAGTTFVSPWDFYNNDDHANDDNGHGSHVTGTISQDTNNAYGVAGVAYNSTIMPVKVLAFDGTGFDDDLVEAIYYAVDHGADVISMSLGFTGTGAPDANGDFCTEVVGLNAALEYAYNAGVVVAAAAGNDSSNTVTCPAAYPTVIAVGATQFDGTRASYSNQGSELDVTAPGGSPLDQNGDGFSDGALQETYCSDWLTLLFLGTYDAFCDVFMYGTSMATPHVAGTAALLLGEDPGLTPDQVRSYIESTARDRGAAGWDSAYGWGVLDASASLAALIGAGPTPTAPPAPTVTSTPQPTATSTPTPQPTATSTPTSQPTATSTPTPQPTPTATPTPTTQPTATATPTSQPTPTATATPTTQPTATATPTPSATPTATPTPQATISVDAVTYSASGGRNSDRHVSITVAVVDSDGLPVSNANVFVDVYLDSSFFESDDGRTGSDGTVTFRIQNAPGGCYATIVTNVTNGLAWDGISPPNGFCK